MSSPLGALAALGSSFTWAYASPRYTQLSRGAGSLRINRARVLIVLPIYAAVALLDPAPWSALSAAKLGWLAAASFCSYGFADSLFFAAGRRIGISTASAIASIYPLWAAVSGILFGSEPLGLQRAAGALLCVGGVIALIQLTPARREHARDRHDLTGIALALVTSLFWAMNTVATRYGAADLTLWQSNALRYGLALGMLSAGLLLVPRDGDGSPIQWRRMFPPALADCLCGSLMFVYGLTHAPLGIAAPLTALAPLISVPVAIALGEERWSGPRFMAIAATVAGVVILVTAS